MPHLGNDIFQLQLRLTGMDFVNFRCGGADVLSVFVYSDGTLARVDDFCGISIPLATMSNGNKMTLELDAPHSSRYNWGFTALYFFVTGMNFGISSLTFDFRWL